MLLIRSFLTFYSFYRFLLPEEQVVTSAHVAWEVWWGQCLTCFKGSCHYTWQSREGWPLLTVETGVNGDSKSTNEKVLPWLVCWACRAGTRDFCSAWAALVGPVQNIFFLTVHYFNCWSPSPSKLGRQPCWVAWNLECVSDLWSIPPVVVKTCCWICPLFCVPPFAHECSVRFEIAYTLLNFVI